MAAKKPDPSGSPPLSRVTRERVLLDRRMVKNAPYNPRIVSDIVRRRVSDNLRKRGLIGDLGLNRRTEAKGWQPDECGYYLLAGHVRLSAIDIIEGTDAYSLHFSVVELTKAEEREQNVFMNAPGAQGQFDNEALERLLLEGKADSGEDFDLTSFGLDQIDVDALFPGSELNTGTFDLEPGGEADQLASELAKVDAIKKRKKEYKGDNREEIDGERQIVVTFKSRAECDAVLRKMGMGLGDRFVSGDALVYRCGVSPEDIEAERIRMRMERETGGKNGDKKPPESAA